MKQDKPQLLLKHYLKKLKLPTMLRDYEALAACPPEKLRPSCH